MPLRDKLKQTRKKLTQKRKKVEAKRELRRRRVKLGNPKTKIGKAQVTAKEAKALKKEAGKLVKTANPKHAARKKRRKNAPKNFTDLGGVGEKRAEALKLSGFESPADLQSASPDQLAQVSGIGEKQAKKLILQSGGKLPKPKKAGRGGGGLSSLFDSEKKGLPNLSAGSDQQMPNFRSGGGDLPNMKSDGPSGVKAFSSEELHDFSKSKGGK